MRFLLDQNISPLVTELLRAAEHDAVHLRDLDMSRADDEIVLSTAAAAGRTLISSDTDFGELLARTNLDEPSLLLL